MFLIFRTSLLPIALCVRFVVLRDAEHGELGNSTRQMLRQRQEYTVVHTVQAADTSLLFEYTMLHSKPGAQTGCSIFFYVVHNHS